jgi:hypothetical protein
MRKISQILGFLYSCILIHSCVPYFHLQIDGACEKSINFPCGRVSLSASRSLGLGYDISYMFDLSTPVTLHFDSLKIMHHGTPLKFEIFDEASNNIEQKIMNLSNKKNLVVRIPQDSLNIDTLIVSLNGFMVCDGVSVYDGDLKIVLTDSSGKRIRCPTKR